MKHMKTGLFDESDLEEALFFASQKFSKKESKKGSFVHSVRVASILWDNRASQDSVTSAILHDILEDTPTTKNELSSKFSVEIVKIVDSLTIDKSGNYDSRLRKCKQSYQDSFKIGYKATVVRAVDLIDNSYYFTDRSDLAKKQFDVRKFEAFMQISQPQLEGTVFWELLNQAYENNVKALDIFSKLDTKLKTV